MQVFFMRCIPLLWRGARRVGWFSLLLRREAGGEVICKHCSGPTAAFSHPSTGGEVAWKRLYCLTQKNTIFTHKNVLRTIAGIPRSIYTKLWHVQTVLRGLRTEPQEDVKIMARVGRTVVIN